jgi:hypothetical protein
MNDEYATNDQEINEPTEHWEPVDLQERPKWPKVIGIISIVFGALGLTCGGIGLVAAPLSAGLMENALEGDPLPYGMEFTGVDYAIGGVGLVMSVVLLIAGITAVTRRPLTRSLHLIYGACGIPLNVWSMLNQMGKQELNQQWAQEFPNNPMAANMSGNGPGAMIGQVIALVLMLVLGFGVPIFYLIWFGLVKTKPEQITGGDEGVY